MSFLDDQVVINNSTIIMMAILFLVNKYIEKKYRINLPDTDLGKIDLMSDRIVDNVIKQETKFRLLWNRITGKKTTYTDAEALPSETRPDINKHVDDVALTTAKALSEMQLQLDNLQYKLKEAIPELDLSNGEEEIEVNDHAQETS